MREPEFRQWLQSLSINRKPITDCVSRCKKVETALSVDLDKEYKKNHGQTLLSKLAYSTNDEKANKPVPEGFNFKPGVCIRFRFTDFRSAVKKYFTFCDSTATSK